MVLIQELVAKRMAEKSQRIATSGKGGIERGVDWSKLYKIHGIEGSGKLYVAHDWIEFIVAEPVIYVSAKANPDKEETVVLWFSQTHDFQTEFILCVSAQEFEDKYCADIWRSQVIFLGPVDQCPPFVYAQSVLQKVKGHILVATNPSGNRIGLDSCLVPELYLSPLILKPDEKNRLILPESYLNQELAERHIAREN